jgi:hypothetical protein
MTDEERKAEQAESLLKNLAPYMDSVEGDVYQDLLASKDANTVLELRLQILALHLIRGKLRTTVMLGKQSARKAPAVA